MPTYLEDLPVSDISSYFAGKTGKKRTYLEDLPETTPPTFWNRVGEIGLPILGGLAANAAFAAPSAATGAEVGSQIGAVPFLSIPTGGASIPVGAGLGGLIGGAVPFFLGSEGTHIAHQQLAARMNQEPPPPLPSPKDLAIALGKTGLFLGGAGIAGEALEVGAPALAAIPLGGAISSAIEGAAGGLASSGPAGVVPGALSQGAFTAIGSAADRLTGYRRGGIKADERLAQASQNLSLQFRPDGKLHQDALIGARDMGQWAWDKFTNASRMIAFPLETDPLVERVTQAPYAVENPARVKAATNVLDDILKEVASQQETTRTLGRSSTIKSRLIRPGQVSVSELVDASNRLGQRMTRGVVHGTTPMTPKDLALMDAREAIADEIDRQLPDHLKGALSEAKQWYKNFAQGIREPLHKHLQPTASKYASTNTSSKFIESVADKSASISDINDFHKIVSLTDEANGRITPEEFWQLHNPSNPTPTGSALIHPLEVMAQQAEKAGIARNIGRRATNIGILYPLLRGVRRMLIGQ